MTRKPPRPERAQPAPVSRRYQVPRILRTRDLLIKIFESEYGHGDRTIPAADFDRCVQIVAETLGGTLNQDAIRGSLRLVAGVPLTPALLRDLAHRLAGNIPRLKAGQVVTTWAVQRFPEWVPIQVLKVSRALSARGSERGADLTLKYLAGTPCPRITLAWWSLRRCGFLAHGFGFSRWRTRSRYPYTAPEQLTNLRFDGLVDPEWSSEEPRISQTRFTAAHLRWNRALIRRRFRVDEGYDCPEDFPVTFPCHLCPFGFLSCPAGTHRHDYVQKACPQCGVPDAYFDTDNPSLVCRDCTVENIKPVRRS